MIDTIVTQRAQLRDGFYRSGSGPTIILLLGSCRTLHYLNYLSRWNDHSGNKLTIYRIDVSDWHWNEHGQPVDFEAKIAACENDQRILSVLKSAEIFLHEWYAYHGMFNTDKTAPKNVYQFGLSPKLDVCLPNWHDRWILFNDHVQFNEELRTRIKASGMTPDLAKLIVVDGMSALEKFFDICRLSSFPEFAGYFLYWWTHKRFFWTGNHVSKEFTLYLYRQLNDRFLHLPFDDGYWKAIDSLDIFSSPCTAVTKHDVDGYSLSWPNCPIEALNL